MNVPIWAAWVVVAVLAVISVVLLSGKGSFLIAGYNTASKENKQKFDAKKLCRVVGGGTSALTIILGITTCYGYEGSFVIPWLMPFGFLGTIAVITVLANTMCGAKPDK